MKKLASDTILLRYFGGECRVSELKIGDIVITEDSKPNVVKSIKKDKETSAIKIIPEIGDSFISNVDSMFAMFSKTSKKIIDYPLNGFLSRDLVHCKNYSLVSVHINYARQELKNDSYLVGMIAGRCVNDFNSTVKDFLARKLDKLSDIIAVKSDEKSVGKKIDMAELTAILKDKKIPEKYIYNIRNERLNLLKGIIDSQITNVKKTTRSRSAERGRSMQQKTSINRSNSQERSKKMPEPKRMIKYTADSVKLRKNQLVQQVMNKSKIPRLQTIEYNLYFENRELGEQIKYLILGLGFKCIYTYPELTSYGFDIESDNIIPMHTMTGFKVEKAISDTYYVEFSDQSRVVTKTYNLIRA